MPIVAYYLTTGNLTVEKLLLEIDNVHSDILVTYIQPQETQTYSNDTKKWEKVERFSVFGISKHIRKRPIIKYLPLISHNLISEFNHANSSIMDQT